MRGPSGAGKTLLLRAVADLDPNEGLVTLEGRDRSTIAGPEWRRLVGHVPAEPGWCVLGQQYHTTGAPMDGSAVDNHNRRVYEETLKVIKKAWTEEAWEYNGEYYKVPYPYEEGIRRWPVAEWTRTYGAPGEVDQEGVVRKICVVPKPYQDPYPPLFQPFSVSENTIRYTAQSGIVPWILVSYPPDFQRLCRLYREVAAENGRNLGLGEIGRAH